MSKGVACVNLQNLHFICVLQSYLFFNLYLISVPTAPPQNVVVQSSTATQLDVTWDPPPLDAQNGDIQGYKVSKKVLFLYLKINTTSTFL